MEYNSSDNDENKSHYHPENRDRNCFHSCHESSDGRNEKNCFRLCHVSRYDLESETWIWYDVDYSISGFCHEFRLNLPPRRMNILIVLFVVFAFLQGCSKIEDPQPSLRKKVANVVSSSGHPTGSGTLDSETVDDTVGDAHPPNAAAKPVHVSHENGGEPVVPTQRNKRGPETTTVHPNAPLGAVQGEGNSTAADSGSAMPDHQFPNQSNRALGNGETSQIYPALISTTLPPCPIQSRRQRHVDPHVVQDMARGNPNGVVRTTTPAPGCLTQFVRGLGCCCMGVLDIGLRNLQR